MSWDMYDSLTVRGNYLLQTGDMSDCNIYLSFQQNHFVIKGHKVILAGSPVFRSILYANTIPSTNFVYVTDVSPTALFSLLQFIYTDYADIVSVEHAFEAYMVAGRYMIPKLARYCISYIVYQLDASNVCKAYEFSKYNREQYLFEIAFDFIRENTVEVLNHTSFLKVKLQTVVEIFREEHLNIDSEIQLYRAAERFAGAQVNWNSSVIDRCQCFGCIQLEIPNINLDVIFRDQPAVYFMREALQNVRFLTLSLSEFLEGPNNCSVLSQTDCYSLLMNINSISTNIPMPYGFSTKRISRKAMNYY